MVATGAWLEPGSDGSWPESGKEWSLARLSHQSRTSRNCIHRVLHPSQLASHFARPVARSTIRRMDSPTVYGRDFRQLPRCSLPAAHARGFAPSSSSSTRPARDLLPTSSTKGPAPSSKTSGETRGPGLMVILDTTSWRRGWSTWQEKRPRSPSLLRSSRKTNEGLRPGYTPPRCGAATATPLPRSPSVTARPAQNAPLISSDKSGASVSP